MKKVLVVTHIRQLWASQQSGSTYAINSLLTFLEKNYDVHVYCTKFVRRKPATGLKLTCGQGLLGYALEIGSRLLMRRLYGKEFSRSILLDQTDRQYAAERKAFSRFIKRNQFDVIIFEYLHNHHLASLLEGSDNILLLDTHDVMHLRAESLMTVGVSNAGQMSKDVELSCFKLYSKLLMIQEKEAEYLTSCGVRNLIVVKRPAKVRAKQGIERVGSHLITAFVGSRAHHNVDAIKWFLANVWGNSLARICELHIYGSVCSLLSEAMPEGVFLHGHVEQIDAVYQSADVVLNPIRAGSGLKIKNVEALGFGVPVITSEVGAVGMESCINSSLFVCSDPQSYIQCLTRLGEDGSLIERASVAAIADAQRYFSEQTCFAELGQYLNSL